MKDLWTAIANNLPHVIKNTPYTAAVLVIIGFVLGAVLL